jgi:hypothetical protein
VGEIRNLLCLHSLFDWPFTELFMHVYHGTMLGSRCNLCLNWNYLLFLTTWHGWWPERILLSFVTVKASDHVKYV